jgi:hypothetical protein
MTNKPMTADVDGKSVSVDWERVDQVNGIPGFKVSATFGTTTVEMTHTLGPVDGAHAALETDHVQTRLDDCRQKAARLAVLQEELKNQLDAAQ